MKKKSRYQRPKVEVFPIALQQQLLSFSEPYNNSRRDDWEE